MSNAFKEWALVCEALGAGRQSLLIRKGGIAEGKTGFSFRHSEFFLFPTWFHAQLEKTTMPPGSSLPPEPGEEIVLKFAATVEWTRLVSDLDTVRRLREFHILGDDIIAERFHQDDTNSVHVALVRIFRVDPPARFRNEPKYGGCRSWVEIPDLEGSALVSVLSDEEHERRKKLIEQLLES